MHLDRTRDDKKPGKSPVEAGVEPASETDGRQLLRAYSRVIVPGQAWRPA